MRRHIPILANEIYESLPENVEIYIDGTLGHGGHVEYILSNLEQQYPQKFEKIKVIGIDKDAAILNKAQSLLNTYKNKISFFNDSYVNFPNLIGDAKADFMLLDLGVNMEHFKDASRGFSIKMDGDLDMRFDIKSDFTAKSIIDTYSLEKLSEIFIMYGDFSPKFAKVIAQEIIDQRKNKNIQTTSQLVQLLKHIKLNERKIAVIFQCLRIETNNELEELKKFLNVFPEFLNRGGHCAIITFHSIEDSIVKYAFKNLVDNSNFQLINKHVIKPSYKETLQNKASRSAKLRLIKHL